MAMNPSVYGPMPYKAPTLPPHMQTPPGQPLPPQSFLGGKQYASVAAPQFSMEAEDQGMPELPEADPDPYVGCGMVPGLNKDNFSDYIQALDATFVMFYDPSEPMSTVAKAHIRRAAQTTNKPNHMYVAVDCSSEAELCSLQGVCQPPSYKLFSRGSLVNDFPEVATLRHNQIRNYVETCPVIDNSTPMSCAK